MIFRKIQYNDLADICKMHKQAFSKEHFSSVLSLEKLEEFYRMIIEDNPHSYLIKENEQSEILGFVIGGEKTSSSVNRFIQKNYMYLAVNILVFNQRFIFEKLKVFYKRIKSGVKSSTASQRLLSIAVKPEYSRHGIGKILVQNFEEKLKEDGYYYYGLSVRKCNNNAIQFYNASGYVEEFKTDDSIYFVKVLNDNNLVKN